MFQFFDLHQGRWLIISGIGSARHNITKSLAKMLSHLLGMISNPHIKNANDLLNKINDLNMENKSLASFDIELFYTNVPVKKRI